MDAHEFFRLAFIYLLPAVIAVPLARRLGLGSVLGYLIAGVLIGPFCLKLTGSSSADLMHFAEFGVVMMLFLIGLELEPPRLWSMRGSIFGLGGLQVLGVGTAVCVAALCFGQTIQTSIALGMIASMSSTALVLQSLGEKGLLGTQGGRMIFSVLLFQDIAVIPILAIFPLLAQAPTESARGIEALPPVWRAVETLGAITAIVLVGRYGVRHLLRFIARSGLREVFTAASLVLIAGIITLMHAVGLSPALGAFLAGVVLANSEYRHELEADIEPFKGLLLGLFFITVGESLDLGLVSKNPGLIAGLVGGLIGIKVVVQLAVGARKGVHAADLSLFALALAQGGEFAFLLLSTAARQHVIPESLAQPCVTAVALSMGLTPVLMTIHEKILEPRLNRRENPREPDPIEGEKQSVLLAGFRRFGHVVGRLLRANGVGVTILDHDGDQVDTLRKFGLKSFFGDASRPDLLEAAGVSKASLFILAIDDEKASLGIVKFLHQKYPDLRILARAVSRQHAYALIREGVTDVYRDTLGSALDLGTDALRASGFRAMQARRAAILFRRLDEASVRAMAKIKGTGEEYATEARKHIRNLDQLLADDAAKQRADDEDDAWTIGVPRKDD